MQSSYRNFLAAGIGAVVLVGSAEASLAETISDSPLDFSKPSKEQPEGDRLLISLESFSPPELDVENNDSSQGSDTHQSVTIPLADTAETSVLQLANEVPSETVIPSTTPSNRQLTTSSITLFQPADVVAALESAKAELDREPEEADPEQIAQVTTSEPSFSESDEPDESDAIDTEEIGAEVEMEVEPESEDEIDIDIDIEAEVEAEEGGLDAVPVLENESNASEEDIDMEVDVLESEDVEVEIEAEIEADPEDEIDVEVEVEVEEENLDAVPVLEDVPTGNSASDLIIPTEIIPVISAPDYLNANPNPLYFPTEPEEVDVVGNQPITLAQALELARRNNRELRNARLSYDRAEAALDEALSQRFPRLTAGADLVHTDLNPAVDTTEQFNPFTGETVEVELDRDNNTTTFSADVQVTYDVFTSGQRAASIQAARGNLRQQELQVEVVLEEIRLNVTNAYYDVQETDESVRIAQSTLEESLESLRIAEARERAGVGTRFDRLQAEVDAANSQQNLRSALSDQQIARRQLSQVLSIPLGVTISAADEVEVAGSWILSLEESLVLAFKNRAEPEQLLVQREIDDQQRRAELGALGPQLSAFGRYRLQDLLDETRGNSDNEVLEVGLQLDLLLFDGGATRARARQESIDVEIAESDFADTLEEIRFDVEQAFFQLDSNFENIQTAATAVEVAEESLRLARLRFGAGVGIQSDVITAQADLTQAEFNLVSAILDYNRALVSMQRAVSNLDGNNLSDVP